jgi:hypothetical protein
VGQAQHTRTRSGTDLRQGGYFGSEREDSSLRSFLFLLKNPLDFSFPFALKDEKNDHVQHFRCQEHKPQQFHTHLWQEIAAIHQSAGGRFSAWKQRADLRENDSIMKYEDLQRIRLLLFPCLL